MLRLPFEDGRVERHRQIKLPALGNDKSAWANAGVVDAAVPSAITFHQDHESAVCVYQLADALDHPLQHVVEFCRIVADNPQHIRRRCQVLVPLFQLSDEPRVFNRDGSLVRERLEDRELALGEPMLTPRAPG